MNWSDSILDALVTLGKVALSISAFFFARFSVKKQQQNNDEHATVMDKIALYVASIGITAFVAWLAAGFNDFNLSIFISLLISTIIGIFIEFRRYSKMSVSERQKESENAAVGEILNRKFDNEF